jgi:hypothetical protein
MLTLFKMSRKSRSALTKRQSQILAKAFVYGVVILLVIYGLVKLYELAKPYFLQIGIIIAVLAIFLILWYVWKYVKEKRLRGELGSNIQKALKNMDSTAKTYRDEHEANKQLASELKHLGLPAVHESLGDAKGADIRIGKDIIEGKLEPSKGDIDRLIGQLDEYCKHDCNVYVVVYGRLDKKHLERIVNLIERMYSGRVFLNYLKDPKRRKSFTTIV